ncbi:MAG: hypothetical protein KAR65_03310 [Anaerolineales bacterium]|nr:hypothetical protein [Anaerolineales bacterium]
MTSFPFLSPFEGPTVNKLKLISSRSRIRKIFWVTAILTTLLLVFSAPVFGQSYSYTVDKEIADVYWEEDGSARILYMLVFTNDASGPLMEFVDIGTPNDNYNLGYMSATINNRPISHIADSEYISTGIELGLGSNAIQPGQQGTVVVDLGPISGLLYKDSQSDEYASVRFVPNYFEKGTAHGSTDFTVIFHLPPGVQPDEPRWHTSPGGWPSEPDTYLDDEGRVVYQWHNPSANATSEYEFGASFPLEYVPDDSISSSSPLDFGSTIDLSALPAICCFGGFFLLILGIIVLSVYSTNKRKLDYLPPKISIEGHGIKRGLTAVEAAVLSETPLDRVLTMILFSVVKKGAAKVVKEDPLTLERLDTKVKLRDYELEFLESLIDKSKKKRRSNLQSITINLVKSVQKKMKGFSLKETLAYYKSITKKAWQQVELAETPEIKSERFAEDIEWTLLDDKFDDKTQQVFRTGPVYLPMWWGSYRPSSTPRIPTSTKTAVPIPSGKGISLPTLPGSEFAASVVNSVQDTAAGLVGNLTGFTQGVTKTTNPPPPRTISSGSSRSGGGCACACACAGCACACAGGGR